jgi:hypothetical protein
MSKNVEVVVIDWLESITTGWDVSGSKPTSLPDQFILVNRTGGPREAIVLDRAEILIEVYHKDSQLTASDLANEIADKIVELEAYEENITHADINSVVSLADTLTQYYRYQVYCDVYLRR